MQCRSKVRIFFWGGGGQSRVPKAFMVARGVLGHAPPEDLKYSFKQFLTVEAINK